MKKTLLTAMLFLLSLQSQSVLAMNNNHTNIEIIGEAPSEERYIENAYNSAKGIAKKAFDSWKNSESPIAEYSLNKYGGFDNEESDEEQSNNEQSKEENCAICLDSLHESKIFKPSNCIHQFHFNCLEKWTKSRNKNNKKCPACRNSFSKNDLSILNPHDNAQNGDDATALQSAASSRNRRAVRDYSDYYRDLEAAAFSENRRTVALFKLKYRGLDIHDRYKDGDTLLHNAASNNNIERVNLLLYNGALIDARNDSGETALHRAVIFRDASIVALLLNRGADINAVDSRGDTALHNASEINTANLLSDNSTNIDARNKNSETALHKAAFHGHAGVVDLLLNKGADINARDEFGKTALHNAADNGRAGVVDLLLNRGAVINAQDDFGKTALHRCTSMGNTEIAAELLRRGADINAQDFSGNTALHLAAKRYPNIVTLLLSKNADATIQNNNKITALDIARSQGEDTRVIQLLTPVTVN